MLNVADGTMELQRRPAFVVEPDVDEAADDRVNPIRATLAIAHEEMERLYGMLRPLGYSTIVTDVSGEIVYRRCPPWEEQWLDSMGILAGARRLEAAAGHEALGSGRASVQSACTQRENYSSSRHRSLKSVGFRIFNPHGQCLGSVGALSRSTETAEMALKLVVDLISDWGSAIEERLFRDTYSHAWILRINLREDAQAPALVAIDSGQFLLAANQVARQALGLTEQALGHTLEALGVAGIPVLRKAANPRSDTHLDLRLRDRRVTAGALITAPVEAWSTTEFRQFRTRPRVLMAGGSHASLQHPASSGGLSPHILSDIQRYIRSHLAESIPIATLASKARLSTNYFLSAFCKSTGVTPHRYIVQQRTAKAAELLMNTDMELADIALMVGFADQSHFTRSFSRLMECTPSAFRRKRRLARTKSATVQQNIYTRGPSNVD